MIQLVLDDTLIQPHLYPFTFTRSAADIRIGILTIREKWEKLLGHLFSSLFSGEISII
jgi:UDP-N-acetylglucosamine diphosphorylase / glucose-1-phosphate thymidylyltransferase / UDP-N-acetylgalactosamine diphosphorylase / glucosamine-1-phosphate N-acetyltransferase / galactosamine-1-phosphate N-acetyltransferase